MSSSTPPPRLASLDQFRGYTVAGMFMVNFLGAFDAAPYLFKHHLTFCSYADTIMPQFFFAVGFAMRLSFGRRALSEGTGRAYWHAVKRSLGLALIAILWYGGKPLLPAGVTFNWESFKTIGIWGAIWKPLKVDSFQTLLHIAATSLWLLPVIRAGASWRVLYLVGSALMHLGLTHWFYFRWHNSDPAGIDGGVLGFLTWSIPTLVGTLACDAVMGQRAAGTGRGRMLTGLVMWSLALMALGWGISCGTRWYDIAEGGNADRPAGKLSEHPVFPPQDAFQRWMDDAKAGRWDRVLAEPPFVPPPHSRDRKTVGSKEIEVDNSLHYRPWNYWMMSQQCGSISYLTFSAGVSLAVFVLFYILADMIGLTIGLFRTFGTNALVGYFVHSIVDNTVKGYMPPDLPAVPMWIGFGVYLFCCWLIIRSLEKNKIFIKL
jgi:predicted acyltransferase